ncbi:MAG TPA: hypothetical protein VFV92_00640 [Candidatus Bathyarchaeia archaeon]|nr:hypothetical protein [Candidatus Bathyarchaeia archaeon]
MSDQEALIAFRVGQRLDEETIRRLWASGYLEATDHDAVPNGTRELKAKWITPKGWSLLEKSQPARWRRESGGCRNRAITLIGRSECHHRKVYPSSAPR